MTKKKKATKTCTQCFLNLDGPSFFPPLLPSSVSCLYPSLSSFLQEKVRISRSGRTVWQVASFWENGRPSDAGLMRANECKRSKKLRGASTKTGDLFLPPPTPQTWMASPFITWPSHIFFHLIMWKITSIPDNLHTQRTCGARAATLNYYKWFIHSLYSVRLVRFLS